MFCCIVVANERPNTIRRSLMLPNPVSVFAFNPSQTLLGGIPFFKTQLLFISVGDTTVTDLLHGSAFFIAGTTI